MYGRGKTRKRSELKLQTETVFITIHWEELIDGGRLGQRTLLPQLGPILQTERNQTLHNKPDLLNLETEVYDFTTDQGAGEGDPGSGR